ncbi:MAG: thioredoxin domain-containing protein [Rubricoccaceae bacterium]
MPNRLAESNSPYLLQHAENPVDWWPWSDAAFAEARQRDVPVFLSIGYATCHWCHVMEEESFENAVAAQALNDAFVCIKVDREERPDVDAIYMAACLALNGHGGWPLTALLTHDREPFYVGTYLPRETQGGRIGVIDLAHSVTQHWRTGRAGVERSAGEIAGHIRQLAESSPSGDVPTEADLERTAEALRRRFDTVHAGFGTAPKFPTPHHALFLFREARRTGTVELALMAAATLRAIRRGGTYDHIGLGLHRYSTDREWLLPHFEKMLYDQALFVLACVEGFEATGEPDLQAAAEDTITYVLRDLLSPEGAFFSAEDADSLDAHGKREEGAFYVWTEVELVEALGDEDAALARHVWGTQPEGNYREEATRQRTGANVLHLPDPQLELADPLASVAEALNMDRAALDSRIEAIRRQLDEARNTRSRPLLDDKILTDWNGLMIAALARAGRAFRRDDYIEAAERAARFLLGTLHQSEGGLLHRYRAGEAGISGMLDDYAFLAFGLTELYQTTFEPEWLSEAVQLHRATRDRFESEAGDFFASEADATDLIVRQKSLDDGAIPSGNSVALLNGLRLGRLTGDRQMEEAARCGLVVPSVIRDHPSGFTFWMTAAAFAVGPSQEVVIASSTDVADEMVEAIRQVYAPNAVVLVKTPETTDRLSELAPFTAEQTARDGLATAYVCQDYACNAPTTSPSEATQLLREAVGPASSTHQTSSL